MSVSYADNWSVTVPVEASKLHVAADAACPLAQNHAHAHAVTTSTRLIKMTPSSRNERAE
jgi:hypothetical protein